MNAEVDIRKAGFRLAVCGARKGVFSFRPYKAKEMFFCFFSSQQTCLIEMKDCTGPMSLTASDLHRLGH